MEAKQAEEFVERFREAWAAKDPARLQALFHPGASVRQPPVREPFNGHQVADYFAQVFVAMPDLVLTPIEWTWRGDVVMIEWEITATVNDEPLSWRGIDRFSLRDGLADDEAVYFDSIRVWERLDPSMSRDSMIALS